MAATALGTEKTHSTGGTTTAALGPLAGLTVTITLSTSK